MAWRIAFRSSAFSFPCENALLLLLKTPCDGCVWYDNFTQGNSSALFFVPPYPTLRDGYATKKGTSLDRFPSVPACLDWLPKRNQKRDVTPIVFPRESLQHSLRTVVGPLAMPDELEFVPSLPKTRSGKIMRRVIRAKELGEPIGDVSTLET
jgi:AMP-binding enzyme C-terminal domain